MDWQPIETAPKDGTAILLLSKRDIVEAPGEPAFVHEPRCAIGLWNPNGTSWTDEFGSLEGQICQLSETGNWRSSDGWFQPNEVTHWMPLPAPPENI